MLGSVKLNRLNMDIRYIHHGECVILGDYRVTAIESLHDISEGSLIFVVSQNNKSMLYGTDLLAFSDRAWSVLKAFQLDLVILDHTYGAGYNAGGHLDAGQFVDILAKMKAEKIIHERTVVYATHISHEGNNTHTAMEALALRNGYQIAYDGLEIEI